MSAGVGGDNVMSARASGERVMSERSVESIEIDDALLQRILDPYLPHCRFLRRAVIEYDRDAPDLESRKILCRGEFEVSGPWYIQDTGHFNAVDFVICFNQIAYTTSAQCLRSGLVPGMVLDLVSESEFDRRKLQETFIAKLATSFREPMKSGRFEGRLALQKIFVRSKMIGIKVSCEFGREGNAAASGEGTLVMLRGSEEIRAQATELSRSAIPA